MSTKYKQLAVLTAIFTLAIPGAFGDSQLGYGETKCSLYGTMQSKSNELSSAMDSWTLGYLSGLNQAAVKGGAEDLIRTQQADRVISFIRGYCESNPGKTLSDAAGNYWYGFVARK